MIKVSVVVEDKRWDRIDIAQLAEQAGAAALKQTDLPAKFIECGLLATSDSKIASLNATFRGERVPTNVLSFPSNEEIWSKFELPDSQQQGFKFIGDIAIAWETCEREASQKSLAMTDHLSHLIVHSFFHLAGIHHGSESEAKRMEELEIKALAMLGKSNPYE